MQIDEFVDTAVTLMDRECGLVAAYVVGSLAAGDVAGGASDVDLLLVTDRQLPEEQRLHAGQVLADLGQRSPLRGVEAVLYRADVLARPRHPLTYELNVNAGPGMTRSVTTGGDAAFWFLLDIAAARQHALTRKGPPAPDVIGPVPDSDVRTALLESLEWHRTHGQPDADAALTVCRGLHWLRTGTWLPKTAAGEAYLLDHDSRTVREALALRRSGVDGALDELGVRQLQDELEAALTT